MITLQNFDDRLALARTGDPEPRGQRVVVRDAVHGAELLRRFVGPDGARAMRRALALTDPGPLASLRDGDVLHALALRLAQGRLSAYAWRGSMQSAPRPDVVDEAPPRAVDKSLTWIEIELRDTDGDPVANERYTLKLPDGTLTEGHLDATGRALVKDIPSGQCKVSFPDLDASDWRAA